MIIVFIRPIDNINEGWLREKGSKNYLDSPSPQLFIVVVIYHDLRIFMEYILISTYRHHTKNYR